MQRTFVSTVLVLLSPLALAHPGEHHEGVLSSLMHLLTEPDHLALMLLAIVAGWSGARLFRRRQAARNQQRHR